MMTLEKVKELKRWLSAEIIMNNSCNAVHKVPWFGWRASLEPMIDSIESEASELVEESETFAKRVQEAVESHEDVTLFGVDYMPLPVDADGVPIHVGDVVENLREDLEPRLHHRFKVYGIHYRDCEQMCALTEDGYPTILYRANECRHYHEPTVEDVLREMLYRAHVYDKREMELLPDLIAEYAAKLQFTEDYTEHMRSK